MGRLRYFLNGNDRWLKENSISVCQSLKNGGIKPLMPNIIYQNVNMKAVVVRVINS